MSWFCIPQPCGIRFLALVVCACVRSMGFLSVQSSANKGGCAYFPIWIIFFFWHTALAGTPARVEQQPWKPVFSCCSRSQTTSLAFRR